jgi:hypothetical protein
MALVSNVNFVGTVRGRLGLGSILSCVSKVSL